MALAVRERLGSIQAAHDAVPRPPQIGRSIGLGNRPAAR